MVASSRNKTLAIPAVPSSQPTPFPRGAAGTSASANNAGTPFVSPSVAPPSIPAPASLPPAPPAPIAVPPSRGAPWDARPFRGPDAARPLLEREQVSVPARSVASVAQGRVEPSALQLEWIWTDEQRLPEAIEAFRAESPRGKRTAGPEAEARRVVRDEPTSTSSALAQRLRGRDGEPVYAVVTGRLAMSFDVRAELETMVALARPFAVEGEALHQEVAHAEAVLETPVEGAPEVVRRLAERLERTWRNTPRRRAAYDLSESTRRVLLTRRAYAKLAVFGEPHLQGVLSDGRERAMVYLPEIVAHSLPLYAELDVRLLVSVHARQDAMATGSLALRAIAIARTTP